MLILLFSLAVHPDKIRIATGQIAGVDKDGRVSGSFIPSVPSDTAVRMKLMVIFNTSFYSKI